MNRIKNIKKKFTNKKYYNINQKLIKWKLKNC